jgi:hypothetical protein
MAVKREFHDFNEKIDELRVDVNKKFENLRLILSNNLKPINPLEEKAI